MALVTEIERYNLSQQQERQERDIRFSSLSDEELERFNLALDSVRSGFELFIANLGPKESDKSRVDLAPVDVGSHTIDFGGIKVAGIFVRPRIYLHDHDDESNGPGYNRFG